MTRACILIVEDEAAIANVLAASLSAAGHAPRTARTAAQARQELARVRPDLLVVDLGLPDEDGAVLIAEVREQSPVPILVLSARTQEAQKIAALDAGADDYITKPFGTGELLARIRAMLRRAAAAPPADEEAFAVGELAIDLARRQVHLRGEPVHLSPREFALLARLARSPGRVVTHRQLLADVWGAEHVDQLQYLRIYMGHLRAKLEADPAQPRYLLTELGVGYRLADD
jgi:two-component system KDP operon response regulator KdpE